MDIALRVAGVLWFLFGALRCYGAVAGSGLSEYERSYGVGSGFALYVVPGLIVALIGDRMAKRRRAARAACPHCAEPILKAAKVCKHCGRDVVANHA